MTFPDRVLSPEQQAERARKVLDRIGRQIDAWGWECLTRRHQRFLTRTWKRCQTDLMVARGMTT